jgi:hypothetical protein
MKIILAITFLLTSTLTFAEDIVEGKETVVGNKKVVYTYKQYEKFDFDDLNIEGTLALQTIYPFHLFTKKRFTNRLPYRKSFTVEIKKGIERVR